MANDDVKRHHPTARVLDILELLASQRDGLSLSALAEKTGASKSTIFPILKTLTARRYARFDPDARRYSLGLSCVALAEAGASDSAWLGDVHEEMRAIVNGCGEVCQLGVLEGSNVLYIAKVQSQRPVRLISHVGKRHPAANTALGKAMLADYDRERLNALYPDGLRAHTQYTVTNLDALFEQLQEVRRRGYAVDNRELNEETVCLAVPLRQRAKAKAALSVSMPMFRATEETQSVALELLFATQKRVEPLLDALPDLAEGEISLGDEA
jgi:DNA-binding IclR family transcriptional regulator